MPDLHTVCYAMGHLAESGCPAALSLEKISSPDLPKVQFPDLPDAAILQPLSLLPPKIPVTFQTDSPWASFMPPKISDSRAS
ncbi:hypothetical protein TNCV_3908171 [Trichonephila clavipes]|nr:hypothetical protein TNCV_3908171 [Trichonephila clavipes]